MNSICTGKPVCKNFQYKRKTSVQLTKQTESESESCSVMLDPLQPHGIFWTILDQPVHGILQARILEWVALPAPGDLPNPGVEPWSPVLQADSLPTELSGKSISRQQVFCKYKESEYSVTRGKKQFLFEECLVRVKKGLWGQRVEDCNIRVCGMELTRLQSVIENICDVLKKDKYNSGIQNLLCWRLSYNQILLFQT